MNETEWLTCTDEAGWRRSRNKNGASTNRENISVTINDLVTLVPPPALPIENGPPEKWGTIEASLGTAMPPDYREFGLRYGSGRFSGKGFIEVFNPFAESYSELVKVQCNFLRTVKDAGMELPHDPFPALPGLLPWGRDETAI